MGKGKKEPLKLIGQVGMLGVLACAELQAATSSTTFQVKATVLATCTISASGPVDFGSYDPASVTPDDDGTNVLTVTCTGTSQSYSIALNGGSTTGNIAARKMTDGTNTLAYQLYQDAGRTVIWGDGTTGSKVTGTSPVTPGSKTHTVFGRIPPLQVVPTGNYADTITATLTF